MGGGGDPRSNKKTQDAHKRPENQTKMLSLITGKIRNKTENKHC
jgi:hypothetical protein